MTDPFTKDPSRRTDRVRYIPQDEFYKRPEAEGQRALGRDATFSWSRAWTYLLRCNRMRRREVWGLMAAILDRTS